MQVGAATAQILADSPWRAALVASSCWSHAFLTDKHQQLYPDMEADRRLFDALCDGNYQTWRETSLAAVEESDRQEQVLRHLHAVAASGGGRRPYRLPRMRGSSLSRRPSPSTLNPKTAATIASPGQIARSGFVLK